MPSGAGPFRALRHRDFRLLWLGLVGSAIGTWMQIVAQALLVLEISHGSALALGAVSLSQALAFFAFALFGGAVADRVDKRRLLFATQTLCMTFAALLGVLTATHVVAVWMVVVLAFFQGTALSFDQPTRAALLRELVPKEELLNALSLQSIVFTGSSTIGPALAGLSMAAIGYAGNFFANAVSYLAVLAALLAIRPRAAEGPTRTPNQRAIRDGLAAVRADAVLPWILTVCGALLFLGPSPALLLPVMGTKVLHLDSVRLGILFAASGAGTVLGGLGLASAGDPRRKARIVLAAAVLWALALAGFAASRSFGPSLVALLVLGMSQVGVSATTITLLQTRVPRSMAGRVMSLNTLLIMGVRPLGDFAAATVIGRLGAPLTALASAVLVGLIALAVGMRRAVREA
ncbi:MAG TPA: MFS transporter [Polyangiaceae bacterium]|nr:MFS transporter [Polyangiaceae bacterium]